MLAVLASLASLAACGDSSSGDPGSLGTTGKDAGGGSNSEASTTQPGQDGSTPQKDAGANDAADDGGGKEKGPPPISLPVNFTRPDVGTPLTPAELAAATDKLIDLIKDTHYFDVVEERVHGWPQNVPGYWYGTWWSGVDISKSNGKVTYTHGPTGADNNGLRTPPYFEGACYAHLMWGQPQTAMLVRKMARGMSSWALAMRLSTVDSNPQMLTRVSYPASMTSTENGREFFINYDGDRPGQDVPPSDYVHVPTNPTFGDIWIKNNRSKDDMGHIFRGLGEAQSCVSRLDADGQADLAQFKSLYKDWSLAVEANGWGIATLDKGLNVTTPSAELAHYYLFGATGECTGPLMMRMLGHGDPGSLDCGQGWGLAEALATANAKNSVRQIMRTHHEAAANMALMAGQNTAALALLQGLAARLEADLQGAQKTPPPDNQQPKDVVSLALHAANVGVPLTSNEVRFLHTRLEIAWNSYRSPGMANLYKIWDPSTPDGSYSYEPYGDGFGFEDIGVFIGSCASPNRNPSARPILDCAKLLAAFPQN
ncbi:hypothetical protein AKJ09_10393 [Labilithrix luteola]|uniref:Uncharacterized protein n=1 Tax=Labilithrix luteola TaxID=1391654 RepID=A0A0K1QE91_9BACT|nr:hypothetical protein [Labilithrix luteola]AKV03730.1 hypothetical protein AKJ09_10393 [Labilithrix luteola]